jgi:hypothetical protein
MIDPKAHRLLFLDAETYFDDEYSLRKMPTPNYILDPRFELQMVAVKEGRGQTHIIDGPDFSAFLSGFDLKNTTTVTFNSLFDNSILAWQYGFVPARMLDAMGMARTLMGHKLRRFSLAAVGEALGVGIKGDALMKVKGMRAAQIKAAGLWPEFSKYAIQDVDVMFGIFTKLIKDFPASEQRLMDLVLRCCVEPRFQFDIPLATSHLQEVKDAKSAMLAVSGVDVVTLMSAVKFTDTLRGLGVDVETKTSPTGRQVPAIAKTDKFMETLLDHPDMRVQALATARLGHKSTLEETRTEKLLSIGNLDWSRYHGGKNLMPVPLRFGGAHTHRLSGDWGMNMQNLPSSRQAKSKLRRALIAPPGHKVLTCDLGQIEARLVAWICGCENLVKQFADKLDPYSLLAEAIFGYSVDRKGAQKAEGFIGKTGILGLGYGCGAEKFYTMVAMLARTSGIDFPALGITWDRKLAQKAVDTYRQEYEAIKYGWYRLDRILKTAWLGLSGPAKFGPCLIGHGEVKLPSGLSLMYERPHLDPENAELMYFYGGVPHKIYGAKMLENIVQALARIVVMNAALRLADRGYRFVLQAHDELVFIVPDADVDNAKKIIHGEMVRVPSWATGLPLTADVGVGNSYGEAK